MARKEEGRGWNKEKKRGREEGNKGKKRGRGRWNKGKKVEGME